jgi:hypothetical protein
MGLATKVRVVVERGAAGSHPSNRTLTGTRGGICARLMILPAAGAGRISRTEIRWDGVVGTIVESSVERLGLTHQQ